MNSTLVGFVAKVVADWAVERAMGIDGVVDAWWVDVSADRAGVYVRGTMDQAQAIDVVTDMA